MALVLSAAQARHADRWVIETLGLPGLVLMENAGRGVVRVIRRALQAGDGAPGLAGRRVCVVCGAGQNAGDGFVIARHLALMGANVQVLLCLPPAKLTGDALVAFEVCRGMGTVPVHDLSHVADEAAWRGHLHGSEVIVDAIFGTGLRADVQGVPAAAIEAINATNAMRVAVDLPSGLDADTGQIKGVAVRAHHTVTMAALKLGLVLDAGAPVGRLHVAGLGAPLPSHPEPGPLAHFIDEAMVAARLPAHDPEAHKGSRGHLLLVAGSQGKTGAAALAGRAAMRAGAGLATIATTRAGQVALDAKLWEVMSFAFTASEDAEACSHADLSSLAARCKAVALGPGIPTGPVMQSLVQRLAIELPQPLVIDADGLNHLGHVVSTLGQAAGPRVLTPHPGEMGRLMGLGAAQVQSDRLGVVRTLAAASGAVVVLKGARTLIAAPDGTVFINPAASAALATAGSGDVLTGVIGALLAQGLAALDAAICGVYLHGRAAEDARAQLGVDHLVAGDLPDAIARQMQRVR